MQHTEAVRDKSAAEKRSRNLHEKLTAANAEKEDISRRLAEEREGVEKARAEASLALKHATDTESGLKSLCGYIDKTEASTRAGVDREHALLVDAHRQLGARTAPFDKSRVASGGAGDTPVHHDRSHVLRLARYLRGGDECLVP